MRLKEIEVEKIRNEIVKLKNDIILKCNKLLEELEYPPESILLGSPLEYLYPYMVISDIKMDIKSMEKMVSNPNQHGVRFFIDNYVEPIKVRYGNLVCPLYTDAIMGIHNKYSFNEECLNDVFNYYYGLNPEEVSKYVEKKLEEILNVEQYRRKYNISSNVTQITIDKSEEIKRDIVMQYLKAKGLL